MKSIFATVIFAFLLGLAVCDVWRGVRTHPDHPGKCYHTATDHAWSPGEEYKPIGSCYTISCSEGGRVVGKGCGTVGCPEGLVVVRNLKLPHPDCCPHCEDPESTTVDS